MADDPNQPASPAGTTEPASSSGRGKPDEPASGGERAALIKYLRDEAYAVRDCFTRYSVQAMAVSGGLLIAIAKFQTENPYIGIVSIFPIVLLFLVLHMGVHKYATSNRLLGYELHIQRIAHFSRDNCHRVIEKVGWEEGMRAWRVVQPSLWHSIYEPTVSSGPRSWIEACIAKLLSFLVDSEHFKRWYYPIAIKPNIDNSISSEINKEATQRDRYVGYWFDQVKAFKHLEQPPYNFHISYNAGGYLATMMFLLVMGIVICFAVQYVSIASVWISYSSTINEHGPLFRDAIVLFNMLLTVFVVGESFAIGAGLANVKSRIRTLESGLLSIHSCAILWEAVMLAHLRALEQLHFFDESHSAKTMHGYTAAIAEQADHISRHATKIHQWIDESRAELDTKLRAGQSV